MLEQGDNVIFPDAHQAPAVGLCTESTHDTCVLEFKILGRMTWTHQQLSAAMHENLCHIKKGASQ